MRAQSAKRFLALAACIAALGTSVHAQTSVLYWCDSSDTSRLDLVVTKVGNRYLLNDVSGYTNATKNVYYFLDWDMLGTPNEPEGIIDLEVEPAQLHVIHTYEINKPYTVNDFWMQDQDRGSALAHLWVGGTPSAQTNISPQLSEIRESGSWFYFEPNKHLSYFSQRFPAFHLPDDKMFYVQKYNAHDTTNGYRTHGVTKTAITLSVNFFVDDLGTSTNGTNESVNVYEAAFDQCEFSPYLTEKAGVGIQYDYVFMDQEWWSWNYSSNTIARMAWFFLECTRRNPDSRAGDWWPGPPYMRNLFKPVVGNRPDLNPMWVAQDYDPVTAFSNGNATLLTEVYITNGITSSMAQAQSMIPINGYVSSIWSHDYTNTRPDVGYFDFYMACAIHQTRVNKRMAVNAGKPHIWFCSDSLFTGNGEPHVLYRTRTTTPPGVFAFGEVLPTAPNVCEALAFFGLFEGDGAYLWDDKDGMNEENPNCIFKLAKYCQDYSDGRGTWTPDVPGTPIGTTTNSYPFRLNFTADYYALGAWKYSTIADILSTGQKVDFTFSTNNGVTWYTPPTDGSLMCETTRDLKPIVVGGVTTGQIAIAVYHPYQSMTGTTHVIVRYAGRDYGFDVVGKRVRVFKGGLTAPILVSPAITHTPVSIVETPPPWTIAAGATDDVQIASAVLWWSRNGGAWTSAPMSVAAGVVSGSIAPTNATPLDQFQYRIDVMDDQGLTASHGPHGFIYSQAPAPAMVHAGSAWRYLATNAAPVAAWKNPGFDDSLWPTGTTPMGYGGDTDLVTVLSYGPQITNKYPTTYFRTTFSASNTATVLAMSLYARVDDGMVVYLNGSEVQRINMPGGTITYTNLASSNASNAPRPWQVFAINPALLLNGQNTLAVEVHQAGVNSSDIYFDLQLQPTSIFNWAIPVTPVLLSSVQTAAPAWTVSAQTTNRVQVSSMTLWWNRNGGAWSNVPMTGTGGVFSAAISPGVFADGDQFGYEIRTDSLAGAGTTNGPFGFMYMIPKGVDLLPPGSTWKYLVTGTGPTSTWNAVDFDDAAWSSAPAPFGYGVNADAVTWLSYGPDATNKYPSYYFRTRFNSADPAAVAALNAFLRVDDGLVVYINGVEAGRQNMPTGAVTYSTWATAGATDSPRPWTSINIPPGLLVPGTNTVAVEVHQVSPASDDLFFDVFLQPDTAKSITHAALASIQTSPAPWTVSARVNSFVPLAAVSLFWGRNYGAMTPVPMSLSSDSYIAVISPTGLVDHEQFQYRIEAIDSLGEGVTNATLGFMYSAESAPALIQAGAGWKYLAQESAPASTWNVASFDDATWPSGPAPLGFGEEETLGTVLDYGPDASHKYTAYYLRNTFVLGQAAAVRSLEVYCRVDDGLVLYLNGAPCGRVNMPTGTVTHTTLAASNATNPPRPWVLIPVDKSLLVDGTNTVAVEVHQGSLTSSDLSFDLHIAPSWQPSILHTPLSSFTTSPAPWRVSADVDSFHPLSRIQLWWTRVGGAWTNVTLGGAGSYTGSIAPSSLADHDAFQYRLEVEDSMGQTRTNGPFGFLYAVSTPLNFVSPGSAWRYWATNAAPPATWKTAGYVDSAWAVGLSAFGFGADETYGTVLGFGPDQLNKYPTYYFRQTFSRPVTAPLASLTACFQVDDGLVFYINGTEAGRTNMPSGAISYTNFTPTTAVNPPRPWQSITLNPALVVTGQNTIAVEVHQAGPMSGDLCMDFLLYATVTNSMDSDSDGMPDTWEQVYFGGTTNGAPDADPDGDSVSNLREYIAGCDPTSSGSKPFLRILPSTNASFVLALQTASNRLYAVDCATSIIPAVWSVLTNIDGDGSYITFPDGTNASNRRYYRFRARLP